MVQDSSLKVLDSNPTWVDLIVPAKKLELVPKNCLKFSCEIDPHFLETPIYSKFKEHEINDKYVYQVCQIKLSGNLKLGKSFRTRPGLEPGPPSWLPSKCTTIVLPRPPTDAYKVLVNIWRCIFLTHTVINTCVPSDRLTLQDGRRDYQ